MLVSGMARLCTLILLSPSDDEYNKALCYNLIKYAYSLPEYRYEMCLSWLV
jgi:hypothetical protein